VLLVYRCSEYYATEHIVDIGLNKLVHLADAMIDKTDAPSLDHCLNMEMTPQIERVVLGSLTDSRLLEITVARDFI